LVNKITDFVGITSEAGRATAKLIEENDAAIKKSERFLDLNADKYDEYTQRKIKANVEFKKKQNEFLKDEQLTETQRNQFITQAREKANREILRSDQDRNDKIKAANKKAADDAEATRKKNEQIAKEENEKISKLYTEARQQDIAGLKEIGGIRQLTAKNREAIVSKQVLTDLNGIAVVTKAETDADKTRRALDEDYKKSVELNEIAKQNAYAQTANALGALGQVVGQETAAGKALSAASALINTYLGITQIWANKTVIPEPFGTIQKVAATITAAASGFAAVRNINRTKVPGGGGGVSAPSFSPSAAPIAPSTPQAALTQLNQQSINQLSSATNRAYVVESDVTNSQERVTRINRAARLA
jgi:hypothetical protein